MDINEQKIKGLARLICDETSEGYMKALDAVSEKLSGLKWNVLKATLNRSSADTPQDKQQAPGGFQSPGSDSRANASDYLDFSKISVEEKAIARAIFQCSLPVMNPAILCWLFARSSGERLEHSQAELFLPEFFSQQGHMCFADDDTREARLKILTEWPIVCYDVLPRAFADARNKVIDRISLVGSSFESANAGIIHELDNFGYSEDAISLLHDMSLARVVLRKCFEKRTYVNVPPPVVLNAFASRVKREGLDSVLRELKKAETSIFDISPDTINAALVSVLDGNGIDRIEWKYIEHTIGNLSRLVDFNMSRGGYIDGDFISWSLREALSNNKYQNNIKFRRTGYLTRPGRKRLSPWAGLFIYRDFDALDSKGRQTWEINIPRSLAGHIGPGYTVLSPEQVMETVLQHDIFISDIAKENLDDVLKGRAFDKSIIPELFDGSNQDIFMSDTFVKRNASR